MKLARLAAALAALSSVAPGCGGGGGGARVLVSGTEQLETRSVAMLWVGNQAIPLDEQHNSWATGVAVAGPDIYVAGSVQYGSHPEAVYWRNRQVVRLTNGAAESDALAIAIAGGHVYVAGVADGQAVIWRDGVEAPLTVGSPFAAATAIAVTDTAVYVTGGETETVDVEGTPELRVVAKLWVDGVAQSLTDPLATPSALAKAVAVSGTDVHVAGYTHAGAPAWSVATAWSNGTPQPLTDGTHFATAQALALAGGDVIVGGSRIDATLAVAAEVPAIWRNGALQPITAQSGSGRVEALATDGGNVYAAGVDGSRAALWVNGQQRPLASGAASSAAGIALQPR